MITNQKTSPIQQLPNDMEEFTTRRMNEIVPQIRE